MVRPKKQNKTKHYKTKGRIAIGTKKKTNMIGKQNVDHHENGN